MCKGKNLLSSQTPLLFLAEYPEQNIFWLALSPTLEVRVGAPAVNSASDIWLVIELWVSEKSYDARALYSRCVQRGNSNSNVLRRLSFPFLFTLCIGPAMPYIAWLNAFNHPLIPCLQFSCKCASVWFHFQSSWYCKHGSTNQDGALSLMCDNDKLFILKFVLSIDSLHSSSF